MSELPSSKIVGGLQIPSIFSDESFLSALQYKPRKGDVFVVTYPKCGSTWSQFILALILRQGRPIEPQWQLVTDSPHFEETGPGVIEEMRGPGCIKSHLPFHMMPWSDQAKYIYITRNPKDTCVSYYHHTRGLPLHCFNGNFGQYFELFISGNVDFGDYFDHLLPWYAHRNDPNVLLLTYEEMTERFEDSVLKIASFIDHDKYAVPLMQDKSKLDYIADFCSFDHLKHCIHKHWHDFYAISEAQATRSDIPDCLKKVFTNAVAMWCPELERYNICRKGVIGDWRNHFSQEQSERMDEKFTQRTEGTDIPNLWKGYM